MLLGWVLLKRSDDLRRLALGSLVLVALCRIAPRPGAEEEWE
jgi:hypothetical protein